MEELGSILGSIDLASGVSPVTQESQSVDTNMAVSEWTAHGVNIWAEILYGWSWHRYWGRSVICYFCVTVTSIATFSAVCNGPVWHSTGNSKVTGLNALSLCAVSTIAFARYTSRLARIWAVCSCLRSTAWPWYATCVISSTVCNSTVWLCTI